MKIYLVVDRYGSANPGTLLLISSNQYRFSFWTNGYWRSFDQLSTYDFKHYFKQLTIKQYNELCKM
jgi:hypothetical protein